MCGVRRARVERSDRCERICPRRLEHFKTLRHADACHKFLAGRCLLTGAQHVAQAKLQSINSALLRKIIHQRLGGNAGLRHAKATKGPGNRVVGVNRASQRTHVGDHVWATGMDRHPVGDG